MITKNLLPLLCFVFFLGCITIEKMPSKNITDKVSKSDSTFIIPFEAKFPVPPDSVKSASDIYFKTITAQQVKKLATENKVTWIAVWATWCPHSISGLTEKYIPMEAQFKSKGLKLLLVAQDINIPFMQDQVFKSGVQEPTYIIDPGTYGSAQKERLKKFLSELSPGLDSIYSFSPKHVLLDNKGNLIKAFKGDVIKADTIRKYCFNGQ